MNSDYRTGSSRNAESLARFRQQMAGFVRGQQLRDLREARHLSREFVAGEIGVSAKSMYSWEHGGGIKWPNAKKLGRYYKVDPESLIDREGTDESAIMESVNGAGPTNADLDRKLQAIMDKLGVELKPLEETGASDVPDSLQPKQGPPQVGEGEEEPQTG